MQLFKPNPFSVNLPSRNSKSKWIAVPTGTLQLDGKVRKRINWVLNSCNCIVVERDLERSSTPGCQSVWNCELELAQGNLFFGNKIVGPSCMANCIDSHRLSETNFLLSENMCFFHFMLPFLSNAKQREMWKATKSLKSTSEGIAVLSGKGQALPLPQRAALAGANVLLAQVSVACDKFGRKQKNLLSGLGTLCWL